MRPSRQLFATAVLILVALSACSSSRQYAQDARFIAAEMNREAEGGWYPLETRLEAVRGAAEESGCLGFLPQPDEQGAAGYFFFSDAMGLYRVAVLQRGQTSTACGSLWTFEYCVFSAEKELHANFWNIRGPRICIDDKTDT